MELRHLRCFIVLAKELHFTRAAERLHIEQPPLSRTIKELEQELGIVLFNRDRRGTRLTPAGSALLQDTRRLFTVLEQAQKNAKAVAAGIQGILPIAISDGAVDWRLSTFLALFREKEPEIEVRLSEVPLADQLRGLRSGDFAAGFAHTAEIDNDIVVEPLWRDSLVIAVPARHELLAHREIPLHKLGSHPIILYDPNVHEGYHRELARLLRTLKHGPNIFEHVSSLDMMFTLVGAGFGLGFTTQTKSAACQWPDVIIRPLSAESAVITTYLLRPRSRAMLAPLDRFFDRLRVYMCDYRATSK